MQSLTASLLSKNAINNNTPTKRVSNITYRLINECKELRLLISTLRSTISKNDSNLFTIRDFITANTTLLEHDIKMINNCLFLPVLTGSHLFVQMTGVIH